MHMYFETCNKVSALVDSQPGEATDFPGSPVVKTVLFQCRVTGSIPGRGTKIWRTMWHGQSILKNKEASLEEPQACRQGMWHAVSGVSS